ncbi:hypothetical protein ILUMI_11870 [Ignelater luminosus]|uniref:PNT domain-containing protein n=1 Tax=Ignelater luminosus TaxID=2038154 RepID=A0A8K0CV75_IGNLU|nr:hypothetical protein ILUMI_11870 [Ignelater luminosus]
MITPNSESTASSLSSPEDATQKVFRDEQCEDDNNDKIKEDALLSRLKSSELLKHLLSGSGRKVQREDEARKRITKSRRGGESPRGSRVKSTTSVSQRKPSFLRGNIRTQTTVTQVAVTYKTKIEVNNATYSSDVSAVANVNSRVITETPSDNNDIMDEKCDKKQDEFSVSEFSQTSCHLPHSEVQEAYNNNRTTVQNEEEVPVFPRELLENETMDYILAEAQRSLTIQSPSSSHFSHESDSSEILPGPSTSFSQSGFQSPSPKTSSSYSPPTCSSYPTGSISGQTKSSDLKSNSDNESSKENSCSNASEEDSNSDSDVDNAMVMVPSDPMEWTASHIKSWLGWATKKFSLNPEPNQSKFPDSGSELCDLSRAEFETRAGNSRAGALLAKHIAHLRHSVTGRASSPLNIDAKISDDEDKGSMRYLSRQDSSVTEIEETEWAFQRRQLSAVVSSPADSSPVISLPRLSINLESSKAILYTVIYLGYDLIRSDQR